MYSVRSNTFPNPVPILKRNACGSLNLIPDPHSGVCAAGPSCLLAVGLVVRQKRLPVAGSLPGAAGWRSRPLGQHGALFPVLRLRPLADWPAPRVMRAHAVNALLVLQVGRGLVPVLWGRGGAGPARSHLPSCARARQEVPTVRQGHGPQDQEERRVSAQLCLPLPAPPPQPHPCSPAPEAVQGPSFCSHVAI